MASNHFTAEGNAQMVDVSSKQVSKRIATATARISMNANAADAVRIGTSRKGDVLAVARLAAISATKWTAHLIPLCHAIPIESVTVDFDWEPSNNDRQQLICQVTCSTSAKTGIEMEALTGASLAALTVYDMLKSVDRSMQIGPTRLESKEGGRSGRFLRDPEPDFPTK
jgi:cyclic pyranopterin phosphate synthase